MLWDIWYVVCTVCYMLGCIWCMICVVCYLGCVICDMAYDVCDVLCVILSWYVLYVECNVLFGIRYMVDAVCDM